MLFFFTGTIFNIRLNQWKITLRTQQLQVIVLDVHNYDRNIDDTRITLINQSINQSVNQSINQSDNTQIIKLTQTVFMGRHESAHSMK